MRSGRESQVGNVAFAASFGFWFTSREFCGARPAATIVTAPAAWSGLFQSRVSYTTAATVPSLELSSLLESSGGGVPKGLDHGCKHPLIEKSG